MIVLICCNIVSVILCIIFIIQWQEEKKLYKMLGKHYDNSVSNLRHERNKREQYEEFLKMFNNIPLDGKLIGIEQDKYDNFIYVFNESNNDNLDVYLYRLYDKGISDLPRVLGRIVETPDDKYLEQQDIFSVSRGNGYGNILEKYLAKLAKSAGCSKITGELRAKDMQNIPYLINFYQKNGFNIITNEYGFPTKIEKSLT